MTPHEISRKLDDMIYELPSLEPFKGKEVYLLENIGDKYLDIIFLREKKAENQFSVEVLWNGSKMGKTYKELSERVEKEVSLENIRTHTPFKNFIIRYVVSENPKFLKPVLLGILDLKTKEMKVLSPENRDRAFSQMHIKGCPILYKGRFKKEIAENFMKTSLLGSKEKNGLFIYLKDAENVYMLVKLETTPHLTEKNPKTFEELVNEFLNRFIDKKTLKNEFELSRLDSYNFAKVRLYDLKADFDEYVQRIENEANYPQTEAVETLTTKFYERVNSLLETEMRKDKNGHDTARAKTKE